MRLLLSSVCPKSHKLEIGRLLIEDTPSPRSRDGMAALVIALRELYKNKSYRDRILDILASKLIDGKPRTGRPGMDLWRLFVLAQLRLSKGLDYDELHLQANYNKLVRQVMGVEREPGFEEITFAYQTIVDNVSLLDDETIREINAVVVSFGQGEVFKKKRGGSFTVKDRYLSLIPNGSPRVNYVPMSNWVKSEHYYRPIPPDSRLPNDGSPV